MVMTFTTEEIACSTQLDAGKSPTFSLPGYATSRLRPANKLHYLLYANAIYRMSPETISVDKANKNWLLRQVH